MKILLTGTRAPATLDLARRLAAEGAQVIGADSMHFPLGRSSNAFHSHHLLPSPRFQPVAFSQTLSHLIETEAVDLLWPTCEEIFHIAALHDSLSAKTKVLAEPLEKLLLLHHKLDFARWVTELGNAVNAPASWPAAEAPSDQRLVWKPSFSRFATKTRFAKPPADPRGWMAQSFIQGQEFCSWALCVGGEVRALSFYQAAARAGNGASCAFVPMDSAPARAFVHQVARTLGFTGSLAFDFIHQADGQIYVIECNPRLTSGLHVIDPSFPLLPCLTSAGEREVPTRPCQLYLPTLFSRASVAGTSPDVVHSAHDPWPTWGQALTVLEFAALALRHGVSPLAATTRDIEYNGP